MRLESFDSTRHQSRAFDCGEPDLSIWLRRYAKRSQRDSLSRVYMLVSASAETQSQESLKQPIYGYFSLSMCSVSVDGLVAADRARLPRYPVPAVLLTRLAVASTHQGQGLGAALLFKATQKALVANELVAARLFVVDALHAKAAAFYAAYGFVPSPSNPLWLYISLERLRIRLESR